MKLGFPFLQNIVSLKSEWNKIKEMNGGGGYFTWLLRKHKCL